ncbi:MAG: NUDIX hydrolase N-terminal domain-containing protein [Planctomycetes bacterium]|nr:NUDIX hydrolase N-terminal domain-containing protein [Planctomycetota bacterium]
MAKKILRWARKLQAVAQSGLTYATSPYEQERFQKIRAIAAEMLADTSGADAGQIELLFDQQKGYATPKVVARAGMFRDGRILMVREQADGKWSLPGGWVDVYDTPRQAVQREAFEETGFTVQAVKLAYVRDNPCGTAVAWPFHIFDLFFLCRITGGQPTASFETPQVEFFPPDGLPELSPHRVRKQDIELMFRHNANPDLPTDFD